MWISGNHGKLKVDQKDGQVVDRDSENLDEYDDIARFDLNEWRAHYGKQECEGGDILDFGYWLQNGTFEPPQADWRTALEDVFRVNS